VPQEETDQSKALQGDVGVPLSGYSWVWMISPRPMRTQRNVSMIDMEEAARKYRERRPGSSVAESFALKAAELRVVRNKILDRLPASYHERRRAYPDYHPGERISVSTHQTG
jgi:hypothetical protein